MTTGTTRAGWTAFLGKEVRELWRTWRLWVFPGIITFFAVSGPLLALATPALLASLGPQSGMVITIPDPTYVDSYAQWVKNTGQLGILALILSLGGIVSGERRQGTATLVLTRPVSRTAFVLVKALVQVAFVAVVTVLGAAVTWVLTRVIFGEAPWRPLAAATGAWLLGAAAIVVVLVLLSCLVDSGAAAAGLGFAVWLLVSVAGAWGPARRSSPAGLLLAPGELIQGHEVALAWPVATTLVATAACLALAVWGFRRRDL